MKAHVALGGRSVRALRLDALIVLDSTVDSTPTFGPREHAKVRPTADLDPPSPSNHDEVPSGSLIRASLVQNRTPNNLQVPALYFPTLTRMEFTEITVDCVGPAEAAKALPETLHWTCGGPQM